MTHTTTEHTPGTWEVVPSGKPNAGTEWRDIITDGLEYGPSYVAEALERDAYLIAAAPDLLAACRAALEIVGCYTFGTEEAKRQKPIAEILRAAIEKATVQP